MSDTTPNTTPNTPTAEKPELTIVELDPPPSLKSRLRAWADAHPVRSAMVTEAAKGAAYGAAMLAVTIGATIAIGRMSDGETEEETEEIEDL